VGGRLFDEAETRDEEELFHAWNQAQETTRPLVLIADQAPPAWAPTLPDLCTRLAVTPVAAIRPPDDLLFKALIELFFADRGLHVPRDGLQFMADRIDREYWIAEQAVQEVDRFAVAERTRVTLPTIRRALARAKLIDNEVA
jgi:chromosomal replication initiation ATPase DnaA